MNVTYQVIGSVAILVSLVGTWMAAQHRMGWLLCVVSSTMWFPALVTGSQWAAVANCMLSIGICVRNYRAQSARRAAAADSGHPAGEVEAVHHATDLARRVADVVHTSRVPHPHQQRHGRPVLVGAEQ